MPPTTQINIRRDTAANFTSANPTLALGEIAYETDTRNIKVGDGATAWTALGYINPYRGGTAAAPTSNTVLGSSAGTGLASGAVMNVVIGADAGKGIVNSDFNVAVGGQALRGFDASLNTAVGYNAMGTFASGNTGALNTAVGYNAGASIRGGGQNVAVGSDAGSTNQNASNTVTVGYQAATLNTANDITAVGANALDANTTGTGNVAVGKDALGACTTGTNNTAVGNNCLLSVTTTTENTAVGGGAAYGSVGNRNTAVGTYALLQGNDNVAIGRAALNAHTGNHATAVGTNAALLNTASDTTAIGSGALDANTTGTNNTAVGRDALGGCTTGIENTAIGWGALAAALTNPNNTAVGSRALNLNQGARNTACGSYALGSNTSGNTNTAIGDGSGYLNGTGSGNVFVGYDAGRTVAGGGGNTAPATSIYIGNATAAGADSQSNQIVIGNGAIGNGSNTTTIGNSSTTGTFIPAGNLTINNSGTLQHQTTAGNNNRKGIVAADSTGSIFVAMGTQHGFFGGAHIGTDSAHDLKIMANGLVATAKQSSLDFQINNGNLVIGTSGKGIDFSATTDGSGTMTSELLSDYEEGTFTPTVSSGVTTPTYTTQLGWYTKIGRVVIAHVDIQLSGGTANANRFQFGGLPFTSFNSIGLGRSGGYWIFGGGVRANDTDALPALYMPSNSTEVQLFTQLAASYAGTSFNSITQVMRFVVIYNT